MKIRAFVLALLMLCAVGCAQGESYRLSLDATESLYHGPGYDWGYARIVGEDGVFTIVEEALDEENNLWGRLKSGAGWVNLTARQQEKAQNAPFRVCYAQRSLLEGVLYYQYTDAWDEDAVAVYLLPNRTLEMLSVFEMDMTDAGYNLGRQLFNMSYPSPDAPLVLQLSFAGDMSSFGLVVRENGLLSCYMLSISGRDGSLVISEKDMP